MSLTEIFGSTRYVVDAQGEKTDVLVPLSVWKTITSTWEQVINIVEEKEDLAIFAEWYEKRAKGEIETISLDELEEELLADGLL